MTIEKIKSQFNAVSDKYDSQRRELIPCFDDFYGISLKISEQAGAVENILDIGAGTGLMSAFFFEKYPGARLTLVDIFRRYACQSQRPFFGFW